MDRRLFLQGSAASASSLVLAGGTSSTACASHDPAPTFTSPWHNSPDRKWLGAEFWANPLQDWRLQNGRAECANPALDRSVHLLTCQLNDKGQTLALSVRVGRVDGSPLGKGAGSVGFRIGIRGPLNDYRNSLFSSNGLNAGLTAEGGLFIGDLRTARPAALDLADRSEVEIRLRVSPAGTTFKATLYVHDPATGASLAAVTRDDLAADRLVGNLALVANFPGAAPGQTPAKKKAAQSPGAGTGAFWFADWKLAGDRLEAHPDQTFGPILFSQYTLSKGLLKLTAQMPPLGPTDSPTVRLEIQNEPGAWSTLDEAPIHPEARTATFRLPAWDDSRDIPYRLSYDLASKTGTATHHWSGTIKRDPVDKPTLTVADISCNFHSAFPNAGYVAETAKLEPDLLAFVGDQFYESTAGYGVVRNPLDTAIFDYLRKWFCHGWTWRDLTRDRPSIAIPDDHDVYQGNIWGEAGAPKQATQEMGGYDMHPTWINVVHRTQSSHLPDPDNSTTIDQNITVYYSDLLYGRVSFAILADRQFKTGPEGNVPPTGTRGDHVKNPGFDPRTADLPGLVLLGDRQLDFLRRWAADWQNADMKAVISQTIFTGMATTHGGERMRLIADYDTNGWPQRERNAALREIRKARAFHLAGDQHLPAVIHYGIDTHRDGPAAFAGPAVNVGYPRWWEPETPGQNRQPGAPEITGDFTDSFGHPLTVYAVANGAIAPRGDLIEVTRQRASGLGIVKFHKQARAITVSCWPYLADVLAPDTQFPGWPVTFQEADNDGRKPVALLPTFTIKGKNHPVLQVLDSSGQLVHAHRLTTPTFQPTVFEPGSYTVLVGDPDTGPYHEFPNLPASPDNKASITVDLS